MCGDQQLGKTEQVGSDGKYAVSIPKQKAGVEIQAVVSLNGVTSVAKKTVKQGALVPTTISSEIDTNTTQVTGTGEPNAEIKIMCGDQQLGKTGKVGSDGEYAMSIPKQKAGVEIQVVVSLNGVTSVAKKIVLGAPTVNPYKVGDGYVKGTVDKNVVKVALFVNGVQRQVSAEIHDGKYIVYAGDKVIAGDEIQVAGIYSDDKLGPKSPIVVAQGYPKEAPTVNPYNVDDGYVKGTVDKNVVKVALFVNGVQRQVSAEIHDGKYIVYAGDKVIAGDKIQVAGIYPDGILGPKSPIVVASAKPKYEMTANDYIWDSQYITGTFDSKSGIVRVNLLVNGKESKHTEATDGKYSIWAQGFIKDLNDKVEIVGVDAKGNECSRVTVKVVKNPVEEMTLTVDNYNMQQDYITGTCSPNVKQVQLFDNGKRKKSFNIPNGDVKYSIWAKNLIDDPKDKVEIVGVDQYGNKKRVPVTIKEN